jgi:hypothetical protein
MYQTLFFLLNLETEEIKQIGMRRPVTAGSYE